MRTLLATLAAAALVQTIDTSKASAQQASAMRFGVHGLLGMDDERGVGGRLDWTLMRKGLISSVNDDLALTFGGDAMFERDGKKKKKKGKKGKNKDSDSLDLDFVFPVAVQWNFNVSPKFTVFPEVGLQLYNLDDLSVRSYFAAGVRWKVAKRVAVLARVTHRKMFHLGIVF